MSAFYGNTLIYDTNAQDVINYPAFVRSMPALVNPQQIRLDGLTDKGRGQYFYHDSKSPLPVRDISGRGKTEPYIEYGRETGQNAEYFAGDIL